jgi:hypothetical protein
MSSNLVFRKLNFKIINGNIGIGTNNPQTLLHLYSSNNSKILLENALDGGSEITFKNSDNLWKIGLNCNLNIGSYYNEPISAITITSNLNIGIGVSYPREKLEIAGHIIPAACNIYDIGNNNLRFRDIYLSGNTIDLGGIKIGTSNNNYITAPNLYLSGNTIDINSVKISTSNNFINIPNLYLSSNTINISNNAQIIASDQSIRISTNNIERLRITNIGNVGIGTNNPLATLDIKAGTSTIAPILVRSGTNLSTIIAGSFEYNGVTPFFSPTETFRGIIPSITYNTLTSTVSFANVNTAQQIFTTNIALISSRTYEFEMILYKIRTASAGTAVAHTFSLSFTGGASIASIGYTANVRRIGGVSATPATAPTNLYVTSAAATAIGPTLTNLNEFTTIEVKGLVRVTTGGTFIPNITYSVAPVTTPTAYADNIQPNSYMKITQIGTSTDTTIGNTFA